MIKSRANMPNEAYNHRGRRLVRRVGTHGYDVFADMTVGSLHIIPSLNEADIVLQTECSLDACARADAARVIMTRDGSLLR